MCSKLTWLLLLLFPLKAVYSQGINNEKLINHVLSIKDNKSIDAEIFKIIDSLEKTRLFANRYYFLDGLAKAYQQEGNKNREGFALNLLGNLYVEAGYYYDAINTHKKAGLIFDSLKNYSGLNNINTNIGNAFYYIADYDKALEYYKKALEFAEKCPDSPNIDDKISNVYNNIGTVYGSLKKFDLAKLYFLKAMRIAEKHSDSISIAYGYNNIGQLYFETNKKDSSTIYYNLALNIKLRHGDIYDKIDGLNVMASNYVDKKDSKNAIKYLNEALSLIDTTALFLPLTTTYYYLYEAYKIKGDLVNEYKFYKLHKMAYDSLIGRQRSDEIRKQEIQTDFNTIRVADSLEAVNELGIRDLKIQQEKHQNYFLILILILAIITIGLIYSRFNSTKKQKALIEQQKAIVDVKNKEITDSINYAKRLQDAILPVEKLFKDTFREHFVIYHPKDIVSGDFYFYEKKDNTVYIAAADCTGHGVPGAMLSIACYNALQKAIFEKNLVSPGEILDGVKNIITEHFNKTENNISDGMDISLLAVNYEAQKVEWAGANNRLFYVENNILHELKPDRQPVGKSDSEKPFSTQNIPFVKGTLFYLFTDGIIDQFGGDNIKKYTVSKFRTLLEGLKSENLTVQNEEISKALVRWKGNNEQTDDVTVLGVRI